VTTTDSIVEDTNPASVESSDVRSGDPVLLRSIYRGRVRWTFPHHYVGEHDDGRLGLYCRPGNRGKLLKAAVGDDYLEPWVRGDPPHDWSWQSTHVLRFMRPGDAHTVEVTWDESWSHLGWYVNLQAPLRVTGARFDTTDWALDVVVDPDGSWRWKDEDDFAQAIALGVFDEESAAAVRAEGERVVAERPWPTGWEDWRPPADWQSLLLPDDWDAT
jgi:Protein of unknown function (DUF402)